MGYIAQAGLASARDRQGKPQGPSLKPGIFLAKVIYVDRVRNMVDIVLANQEIRRNVPVSFPQMGTRAGRTYIQKVSLALQNIRRDSGRPIDNFGDDKNRTVFCVVSFIGENPNSPICLGFVTPPTSQLCFDREGFLIDRHESDLYSFIENGPLASYDPVTDTTLPTFEWFHPSGFFLRVGAGSGHEDLTGQDTQGLWRVRGTSNALTPLRQAGPDTQDYVPITLKHPSGTGVVLDENLNIQTGPGGQAQVNGCRILTICDDLTLLASLQPVCDRLGHVLVDTFGNPVMSHGTIE